jgi:hypothetical protein
MPIPGFKMNHHPVFLAGGSRMGFCFIELSSNRKKNTIGMRYNGRKSVCAKPCAKQFF